MAIESLNSVTARTFNPNAPLGRFFQTLISSMNVPLADEGGKVGVHVPVGQAPTTIIIPLAKPFVDFSV